MNDRTALDLLRSDRGELEAAILGLGSRITGTSCHCPNPAHEDRTPSASIYEAAGVWRVRCHVCESSWDIFDLRGIALGGDGAGAIRDLRKASGAPATMARSGDRAPVQVRAPPKSFATLSEARANYGQSVESVYEYPGPEGGQSLMTIFRLSASHDRGKKFVQFHHLPDGRLQQTAPAKPWPLYSQPAMRDAESIIVVEGEKCADHLSAIGIVATTSPTGAGKASHADWSPVAGKSVYLWPDNDPVDPKDGKSKGIEHMREVARLIEGIRPAPLIYWIDPRGLGLPDKGDVADLLDEMQSQSKDQCREFILEIMRNAEPLGPSRELASRVEDIISGKHVSISFPWSIIGDSTKALLPGTVTLMGGPGGSTKSFFVMQCLAYWSRNKIPAVAYMLEDDRAYHLHRAMCQISGKSSLSDDEWIRANPEATREAVQATRQQIDAIGRGIHDAPSEQVSLDDLAKWVQAQAESGARIIIIDPITAASTQDKPWVADLKFMMAVKKSLRENGASLILITHPKKGVGTANGKPGSMDDLAGGAAYQRFAHTVLYLEPCDSKDIDVQFMQGRYMVTGVRTVNRYLITHKARNGRGTGARFGMFFNGGTLRFSVYGTVPHKGQRIGEPSNIRQEQLDHGQDDGPTRAERIAAPPSDFEMGGMA